MHEWLWFRLGLLLLTFGGLFAVALISEWLSKLRSRRMPRSALPGVADNDQASHAAAA